MTDLLLVIIVIAICGWGIVFWPLAILFFIGLVCRLFGLGKD